MTTHTLFGIDQIIKNPESYRNLRTALVCNAASLTSKGIHSRFALKNAGFNLTKLFAPEHGFDTTGDDGAYIAHHIDKETQLPIISLYSKKLAPSEADMAEVDVIFIDLPDIGARFYTYLWTMTYVLENSEKYKKPVVLLDRPNPIAYDIKLAEGPALQPSSSSFIGRYNIPITHHCSFGELAQYFKEKYYPELELSVIKMLNWNRKENTGYPFFPTSPAIQKRETTYTYPGACLFEGLNIHEGRGTEHPFSQFGAPWINAELLYSHAIKELNNDADVEIVKHTSTVGIYLNKVCHGLRVIPKNPSGFQSVQYFIKMIQLIDRLFPNQLQERNYLTNVNPTGGKHLDKLLGISDAFQYILKNEVDTSKDMDQWQKDIAPYLLYQ